MENKVFTFDATGKKPGRLATEVASILLGKNSPDFAKNVVAPVTVTVTNIDAIDMTEARAKEIMQTFSGYPSGLKSETWKHLAERRGMDEVFRRIVSGMLPKNKLHKPRMKNLVITK